MGESGKKKFCDIGKVTCLTLRFLRIMDSINVRALSEDGGGSAEKAC